MNNYAKAYTEISEIFKYISEEDMLKIPQDVLNMIEEEKDKNYNFYYNPQKELEELDLLIETKAILINLFRDYWATDEQRIEIKKNQAEERQKLELYKKEKYNPQDIFKNKKKYIEEDIQSTQLIVLKKESFLQKIFNEIKRLFSKKI